MTAVHFGVSITQRRYSLNLWNLIGHFRGVSLFPVQILTSANRLFHSFSTSALLLNMYFKQMSYSLILFFIMMLDCIDLLIIEGEDKNVCLFNPIDGNHSFKANDTRGNGSGVTM